MEIFTLSEVNGVRSIRKSSIKNFSDDYTFGKHGETKFFSFVKGSMTFAKAVDKFEKMK